MKIRAFLAATALISSTIISTAAMAAKPPLVPPATDGMTPQEVCDAQLSPSEQADFTTFPKPGTIVEEPVGDPVLDELLYIISGPTPVGDPVYSDFTFDDDFHRNGGSPNIWVSATAGAVTYPGGSDTVWWARFTQTVQTTFTCEVIKENPNNIADPAGLESEGNITTDEETFEDEYTVHDPTPYVADAGETLVNVLICISPNNTTKGKPGDWRGMHGYATADCPYAAENVDSTWVPSFNAPDVY